jgi:hypothetical protein
MTDGELKRFLLRIALPPVRLGLYVRRLQARTADPGRARWPSTSCGARRGSAFASPALGGGTSRVGVGHRR